MPGIVVAQPASPEVARRLRALASPLTVTMRSPYGPGTALPENVLADAEILFADQIPRNVETARQLRWIQLGSHGYGQVAGHVLPPGVVVTNASGVQDIPIAEWCIMMMLSFRRDLPGMMAAQRERRWDRRAEFQSELRGKRIGVWGYGNVGREIARMSSSIGLRVCILSRHGTADRGPRYRPPAVGVGHGDQSDHAPLDGVFVTGQEREFLSGLDFLALALPLTEGTRGIVDQAVLDLLPRSAVLLNPSRAGLVDESALQNALSSGGIAGAALDDHFRTPLPPDDPEWAWPNVLLTSHIAGSTESTHFHDRVWDLFLSNLDRWRNGRALLNVIAPRDLGAGSAPRGRGAPTP